MEKVNENSLNKLWKDIPKEEQLRLSAPYYELYNKLDQKIKYTLKIIYQGEARINKHYILNLDTQTIWEEIFDEMPFKDIMEIDEPSLIKLVHEFAENKRALWLQPILSKNKKIESELSLLQLALIFFYQGNQITRANGDQIAKEHGHSSGEKLFQKYCTISNNATRTGLETSILKTNNKIKNLTIVISKLSGKAKETAIKDLKILKEALENEV